MEHQKGRRIAAVVNSFMFFLIEMPCSEGFPDLRSFNIGELLLEAIARFRRPIEAKEVSFQAFLTAIPKDHPTRRKKNNFHCSLLAMVPVALAYTIFLLTLSIERFQFQMLLRLVPILTVIRRTINAENYLVRKTETAAMKCEALKTFLTKTMRFILQLMANRHFDPKQEPATMLIAV